MLKVLTIIGSMYGKDQSDELSNYYEYVHSHMFRPTGTLSLVFIVIPNRQKYQPILNGIKR
jgi:hypothetical protein